MFSKQDGQQACTGTYLPNYSCAERSGYDNVMDVEYDIENN